jgi:hypothetical protein
VFLENIAFWEFRLPGCLLYKTSIQNVHWTVTICNCIDTANQTSNLNFSANSKSSLKILQNVIQEPRWVRMDEKKPTVESLVQLSKISSYFPFKSVQDARAPLKTPILS